MKILVDMGHPAHVHLFKNMVWDLEKDGHEVKITARDKEVVLDLLNAYGFKYENIGKHQMGLLNKAYEMIKIDHRLYKVARKFGPDILVSVGSPYAAHVSRLLNKPHIVFEDTEHSREQYKLYSPFTEAICTPSCFRDDLGRKQIRYNGYHELAYLHPNYFKPDTTVLDELNLTKTDKFFILRFVAWKASHDIFQRGLDLEIKRKLVDELGKYGRVFITSEMKLSNEFEKYKITVTPDKIHDLLYYATMLVGDTQTMTTESAILGTPAIRCNSFVGDNDMGNFIELEKKYDLIYSFRDPNKALEKALELLEEKDLKHKWQDKRQNLLKDKIDVTKFMVEFIEGYPESFYKQKNMDLSS